MVVRRSSVGLRHCCVAVACLIRGRSKFDAGSCGGLTDAFCDAFRMLSAPVDSGGAVNNAIPF